MAPDLAPPRQLEVAAPLEQAMPTHMEIAAQHTSCGGMPRGLAAVVPVNLPLPEGALDTEVAAGGGGDTTYISSSTSERNGLAGKQTVSACIDDLCRALQMQIHTVQRSLSWSPYQMGNLEDTSGDILAQLLTTIASFQARLQEPRQLPLKLGTDSFSLREAAALDVSPDCQKVNRLDEWAFRQERLMHQLLTKQQQILINTSQDGTPRSETRKRSPTDWQARRFSMEDTERRHRAESMTGDLVELENSFEKQLPQWRRQVRLLVKSYPFEFFLGFAIATNAIFLGAEVDYRASHVGHEIPPAVTIIRHSYNGLFLIELVLRVLADGCPGFFFSETWAWNCLDLLLVLSSLVEVVHDVIIFAGVGSSGGAGSSMSNTRAFRMFRLTRLVRVVRITRIVRIVRALRTLVYSIMCTMKGLAWAMVLLVIIIYVFSIMFTQAVCDYLVEEDPQLAGASVQILQRYWGSLSISMFTLFKSISSGISWDDVVRPLEFFWLWPALFIVFIFFAYFSVLNVVTGVCCQSAIESAQHDHDEIIQAMVHNKKQYVKRAMALFKSIDADRSGELTIKELEQNLTHPDVVDYFKSLEIEPEDAWTLFKLIDVDDSNVIDLEEFVLGCLRLKGAARSIDVAKLMYDHKNMMKRLNQFMRDCMSALSGDLLDGQGDEHEIQSP